MTNTAFQPKIVTRESHPNLYSFLTAYFLNMASEPPTEFQIFEYQDFMYNIEVALGDVPLRLFVLATSAMPDVVSAALAEEYLQRGTDTRTLTAIVMARSIAMLAVL